PAVVSGALLLQASAAAAILGLELGVLTRAALPIGLPRLSGREKVHGGRVLGRRGPARKRGQLWATLERWPGLARSEGARTKKDEGWKAPGSGQPDAGPRSGAGGEGLRGDARC